MSSATDIKEIAPGASLFIPETVEQANHRRKQEEEKQKAQIAEDAASAAHRRQVERWLLGFVAVVVAFGASGAGALAAWAPDAEVRKAAISAMSSIIAGVITGVLGFLAGRGSK